MATTKAALILTSADLSSDSLSLTTTAVITGSNTTGLKRSSLTSVSKTNRITCVDGDADIAAALVHQGQFIDIMDNHGLKRRYVFIDGSNSSVATGSIIATGTDI